MSWRLFEDQSLYIIIASLAKRILYTPAFRIQLMRFTESEPESLLRPQLNIVGIVATTRPRDLWKPDQGLCQQDLRTNETQVPKLHG